MNPVTDERIRECVRCKNRFLEPADTVTHICDSCKQGGSTGDIDPPKPSR